MNIITKNDLKNKDVFSEFYKTIEYENNSEIDTIINSVKNKGDESLAAGTEGKVAGVCEGMHGHAHRHHQQQA